MNVDTLISILHLADPANNAPWGERMNALKQARRIMDHERISYASIGFSPEEAARIENQFAVAEPVAAPRSLCGIALCMFRPAYLCIADICMAFTEQSK